MVFIYALDYYDGMEPSLVEKVKQHQISILYTITDCSAISLSDFTYYLGETTIINLPACTNQNNTTVTLIPTNTGNPPNLASLIKNESNSFSIIVSTDDSSMLNKSFKYRLDFSNPNYTVISPLNP